MNGQPIRNSTRKIGPGIDVRGMGGYTILPPSGHPSGGVYKWEHMDLHLRMVLLLTLTGPYFSNYNRSNSGSAAGLLPPSEGNG